ncbi:hypothetical protein UPYG_G00247500 [Umbra pygmaea]|uniref:Uncharacterized protein n=1 Tax=Umbra pygmaea TaxID=75934 RepID=A0ABD0WNG1_UMBPY
MPISRCLEAVMKSQIHPRPNLNLTQTVHPIPLQDVLQDVLQVSMHLDQQVQRMPTNTSLPLPDELKHVHGPL